MNACVIKATTATSTALASASYIRGNIGSYTTKQERKGYWHYSYGPLTWLHNASHTRINKIVVLTRIISTTRNLPGTFDWWSHLSKTKSTISYQEKNIAFKCMLKSTSKTLQRFQSQYESNTKGGSFISFIQQVYRRNIKSVCNKPIAKAFMHCRTLTHLSATNKS